MLPISLRKTYGKIRNLITINEIVELAEEIAYNDMTMNMLTNNISTVLLRRKDVNAINDSTLWFRRNLLDYIVENTSNLFETENREVKWFDKNGNFCSAEYPHITGKEDRKDFDKNLFRECTLPETNITLKGSGKMLNNNSIKILETYANTKNMVRDCTTDYIYLYSALEYEKNKFAVSEPMMEYRKRMVNLAEETILYCGYEFADTRKLDSSTRDYSLNRFGHAFQYGDSFQKYLIQPVLTYIVEQEDVDNAITFLKDEYNITNYKEYKSTYTEVLINEVAKLQAWNKGLKVEFSIDGKELGKIVYILDVIESIIENKGYESRTLIQLDFTNSGGIMFANQFGDKKFMTTANLIGNIKQDAHQMVADVLGIDRDPAKKVMQGPNHGARLTDETKEIAMQVFGETYKGINALAEYGKKLLYSGINIVELVAPDGVKGYFYGYTNKAEMNINGTKVNLIAPFTEHNIGERKGYGFGVKPMHMSDAYVVRYIRKALIKAGIPHTTTLDAFYIPPRYENLVANLAYEALDNLQGWFDGELTRMEALTGIKMDNRPKARTIPVERTGNIF